MPSTSSAEDDQPRDRGRPRIPRRIKVVLVRREYPDVRKLAKVLRGLHSYDEVRLTEQQHRDREFDDESR